MTSIDEFHLRYYANRLLREGYISQREYRALLGALLPGSQHRQNIPRGSASSCFDAGAGRPV